MPPLPRPQGCRAGEGRRWKHAVLGAPPLRHAAPPRWRQDTRGAGHADAAMGVGVQLVEAAPA
jgi:hypothetical protein